MEQMNISRALNRALVDAMAADDTVILLGEDIADQINIIFFRDRRSY